MSVQKLNANSITTVKLDGLVKRLKKINTNQPILENVNPINWE
jgi:hypothetical protein